MQLSRKAIPRNDMYVNIHPQDLQAQSTAHTIDSQRPNSEASVAGLTLPFTIWLGKVLVGTPSELVILSTRLPSSEPHP